MKAQQLNQLQDLKMLKDKDTCLNISSDRITTSEDVPESPDYLSQACFARFTMKHDRHLNIHNLPI